MHFDDQIDFKDKSLPNSLRLIFKKNFRVEFNTHSYALPQTC